MTLNLDSITQDHLKASIKWVSLMSGPQHWNLTDEQVAILLGGIDVTKYQELNHRAATGQDLMIALDTIERISLLLGIWKSLQNLAPSNRHELAIAWFNKPNSGPVLMNRSIKDYLLADNTLGGLYTIKAYLDAQL